MTPPHPQLVRGLTAGTHNLRGSVGSRPSRLKYPGTEPRQNQMISQAKFTQVSVQPPSAFALRVRQPPNLTNLTTRPRPFEGDRISKYPIPLGFSLLQHSMPKSRSNGANVTLSHSTNVHSHLHDICKTSKAHCLARLMLLQKRSPVNCGASHHIRAIQLHGILQRDDSSTR